MRRCKELTLNFLPWKLLRWIDTSTILQWRGRAKTSNQQDLAAQGDEGGFASRPRESSWSLRCAIPWIGIGVLGKLLAFLGCDLSLLSWFYRVTKCVPKHWQLKTTTGKNIALHETVLEIEMRWLKVPLFPVRRTWFEDVFLIKWESKVGFGDRVPDLSLLLLLACGFGRHRSVGFTCKSMIRP